MEDITIKRLYYTRSEVSSLMRIPPHVLRTWEQRFPKLRPMKNQSGRILFRPSDLNLVKQIQAWKQAGYTDDKIKRLMVSSEAEDLEVIESKLKVFSPQRALFAQMVEGLEEILDILEK